MLSLALPSAVSLPVHLSGFYLLFTVILSKEKFSCTPSACTRPPAPTYRLVTESGSLAHPAVDDPAPPRPCRFSANVDSGGWKGDAVTRQEPPPIRRSLRPSGWLRPTAAVAQGPGPRRGCVSGPGCARLTPGSLSTPRALPSPLTQNAPVGFQPTTALGGELGRPTAHTMKDDPGDGLDSGITLIKSHRHLLLGSSCC